jgi:hypothetical protein
MKLNLIVSDFCDDFDCEYLLIGRLHLLKFPHVNVIDIDALYRDDDKHIEKCKKNMFFIQFDLRNVSIICFQI